jgi:hypothetical protein
MKKVVRFIAFAFVFVSLIGLVTSMAIWWRSYQLFTSCDWSSPSVSWASGACDGRVFFTRIWQDKDSEPFGVGFETVRLPKKSVDKWIVEWLFHPPVWNRFGLRYYQSSQYKYFEFDFHEHPKQKIIDKWAITAPCWSISILMAILPLMWGWRYTMRRIRNRANGRGFDPIQRSIDSALVIDK